MDIEKVNLSGSNDSAVRPNVIYGNMLDQMRYIYALKYTMNKSVLDFACGVGWGSYLISMAGANKVFSVDLSHEAIDAAKKYYFSQKINYLCNNLEKLLIPEKSVDVITSFETLEHLSDPKIALDIFYKLIKEDGLLILSTPNGYTTKYQQRDKPFNKFHYNEYYKNELDELLKDKWDVIEYRGQYPMKVGSSEINKYRKFIKNYFWGLKLTQSIGIIGRTFIFILKKLGALSLNDPAFQSTCEPVIITSNMEPAYHYYILKPKPVK